MPPSASRARRGASPLKLAICLLLPCLVLAGAFSVRIDSLVIVAPYVLGVLGLLLALTALLNRRWRPAALALLAGCVIAGAVLVVPLFTGAAGRQRPGGKTEKIRLISFNMYQGNFRAGEAVNWILAQKPDFIVLLEAAPVHEPEIARLRQLYPFSYGCAGAGFCSTIILSRRPASTAWPHSFGDPENRRGLSAVTARFAIAGQDVPLTAVHLDRPWPMGRQDQFIPQLTQAIATVGGHGIVAGDFNSAPWTFAIRRSVAAGELRLTSGFAGTWPAEGLAGVLRLPLDQVYIGPCMVREDVRRGPELGSDHLPVVTDIVIGDCRA
jgi:endonuclease/exonuclease/phosphatase (EEP) superfamily protein YafD